MDNALDDILQKAEENYHQSDVKYWGVKVRMLTDLGYLKTEFMTDISIDDKIEQTYQLFFADFKQSGLMSNKEINDIAIIYQKQSGLKLLERVTDIDEGLQMNMLP